MHEDTFNCNVCTIKNKTNVDMNDHTIIHMNCNMCTFTITTNIDLNDHMIIYMDKATFNPSTTSKSHMKKQDAQLRKTPIARPIGLA